MASIRRTNSPMSRPGTPLNGEFCTVASPLSKSSSGTQSQNYTSSNGLLSSLYASLDSQAFVLGVFSPRSSKMLEKSKPKGQVWRRALSHFLICFMLGVFIGATPFASMSLSTNLMANHQDLSFDRVLSVGFHSVSGNVTPVDNVRMQKNATMEAQVKEWEPTEDSAIDNLSVSPIQESDLDSRKLLIIVTPTYAQPFQAYNLNRLAHTLRLVSHPLLWIVVEMTSQSAETTDILRRTGIMYRHLVCSDNLTDVRDRSVHQRNAALSHIETHRLDGIIYFADEENIYFSDLFEHMRQIRRFGTWPVAKITGNKMQATIEGPVCNGTQVIGWHTNESSRRFQRFHAHLSGFAFNSTILWDPKRWHRPTPEPIRQLDRDNDDFKASTFIEQVVEDESQMEGLLQDCSRVLVWHDHHKSSNSFYPHKWFKKNNLDVIASLSQMNG